MPTLSTFTKKVEKQTVMYSMKNPDETGLNWTYWPESNHVVMGSSWNQIEGEEIRPLEFFEAYDKAISLISLHVSLARIW